MKPWMLLPAAILFGLGLDSGGCFAQTIWREQVIRHHAAHYDQQTGDWMWNQPEESK
jgi:hypothetical protein